MIQFVKLNGDTAVNLNNIDSIAIINNGEGPSEFIYTVKILYRGLGHFEYFRTREDAVAYINTTFVMNGFDGPVEQVINEIQVGENAVA